VTNDTKPRCVTASKKWFAKILARKEKLAEELERQAEELERQAEEQKWLAEEGKKLGDIQTIYMK
jgi:hypothetical protein